MHKDVILIEKNLRTDQVLSWDDCLHILDLLNQNHFCTLYWISADEQKAHAYSTEHHERYKFAINVIAQSDFDFHKTLNLCDTEDILILHNRFTCDIEKAFASQKDLMMDCTILGTDIENASGFILYRKGFQSLPFTDDFNFISDYILKADFHQHNIQYYS